MTKKYDYKQRPSAEYRFFVYDPEGDSIVFFRDEVERDAYMKESIRKYLAEEEGWSEKVEEVCAGQVTHAARKTNVVKRPPEDEIDEDGIDGEGKYWDPDWSEMCDYEMAKLDK